MSYMGIQISAATDNIHKKHEEAFSAVLCSTGLMLRSIRDWVHLPGTPWH